MHPSSRWRFNRGRCERSRGRHDARRRDVGSGCAADGRIDRRVRGGFNCGWGSGRRLRRRRRCGGRAGWFRRIGRVRLRSDPLTARQPVRSLRDARGLRVHLGSRHQSGYARRAAPNDRSRRLSGDCPGLAAHLRVPGHLRGVLDPRGRPKHLRWPDVSRGRRWLGLWRRRTRRSHPRMQWRCRSIVRPVR
jgi:hypothetical protein